MEDKDEKIKSNNKRNLFFIILTCFIIVIAILVLFINESSKNNVNNSNETKKIDEVETILNSYTEDIGKVENLTFDNNYNNNYRFTQTYKGIEVYGGGIVATLKDEQLSSVINYNYEIPDDFNVEPKHTADELLEIAERHLGYDGLTPNNSKLIIFPINMSEFTLAYLYDFNGIKIIVRDMDQTILTTTNTINSFDINNTSVSEQMQYDYQIKEYTENEKEKYKQNDGTYWLKDNERNIEFYKIKEEYGNIVSEKFLNENNNYYTRFAFEDTNNWNERNDNYAAILAMENIQKVYDYYKKEFNFDSINGSEGYTLKVFTNTKIVERKDYSNNAFLQYINKDDIRIYFGASNKFNDNIETAAHEYTHGYFNLIVEKIDENETKTVNEAYADIMALIIEAYYENESKIDGILQEEDNSIVRNIKDSELKYNDYSDKLEYHSASMIVSKIAYLMSIDETLNLDINELANLWFNSMYKLPKHYVDISDVETAVLIQAKELGYSKEKIKIMSDIFASMGYQDYYEKCIENEIFNLRKVQHPNNTQKNESITVEQGKDLIRRFYPTASIEKIEVDITQENINNESFLNYYIYRVGLVDSEFFTLAVNKYASKIYLYDEQNQNNLKELNEQDLNMGYGQ